VTLRADSRWKLRERLEPEADATAPKSTSNIFTGTASAFEHAGFKKVARCATARPIMRHDLTIIAR
jgi:hypothetical protein